MCSGIQTKRDAYATGLPTEVQSNLPLFILQQPRVLSVFFLIIKVLPS
jgi:hypothetical protein